MSNIYKALAHIKGMQEDWLALKTTLSGAGIAQFALLQIERSMVQATQ